jgi:hypothetical protein
MASTPVCEVGVPKDSRSTTWPGAMSLCATAVCATGSVTLDSALLGADDAGMFCASRLPLFTASAHVVPAAMRFVATSTWTACPSATARLSALCA